MDDVRFDNIARALVAGASRRATLKWLAHGLAGGLLGVTGTRRTLAQDEEAKVNAGAGGRAAADASGGAVSTGPIASGENRGASIGVRDTSGGVAVEGGDVASTSRIHVSADGGTAIADANGGFGNTAGIEAAGVPEPAEVIEEGPPPAIPPELPEEIVGPPAPPACVPQNGACTRQGMACCAGSECITGDSATGFCRALCGAETTRCNDTCIPFCGLNVPNPGGCAGCACRSGQVTCTLGTQYTNPDTCCLSDEECCRIGPIGDPTTYNACCPVGTTCTPGVGCA